MKKVLMSVALVSAIAIAAGYSMIGSDKSEENVADLTSANVEALADGLNDVDCVGFGWKCQIGWITFESKKTVEPEI